MTSRPASEGPRVVHFSPVSFGEDGSFGGGERYPLELARAMALKTRTTLVTFADVPKDRVSTVGDLTVVKLRDCRLLGDKALNPFSPRLLPFVRQADVLHLHQWESLTSNALTGLARALRVPVFVTDHGGATRNFWRRLRLDRAVTGFLPVSDFSASFYPEMRAKTVTILGGVDTDDFRPRDSGKRGDHVLFVGRLMAHKGIDVLIEALDEQTPLRVIGRPQDPAFLQQLRQLAEGKRVEFVLDASDEQIREEYTLAKVAVLPSLHTPPRGNRAPKSELLGLTLLEAMASGTPVVCTRTGGMPEIVEDGVSGRVVEPNDRVALGEAVRSIISAPDWSEMSAAARARIESTFTWSHVADRCLTAYFGVGRRRG